MNRSPLTWATGLLLIVAGAIWVLQGLDASFAPKSFMTSDRWWVVWGIVAVAIGALTIARGKKR